MTHLGFSNQQSSYCIVVPRITCLKYYEDIKNVLKSSASNRTNAS